ncbi:helix-turn-helix domain-containing protein [Sphingobacterium sp.]|uniref:helix-turn-helix domain-containing protein n=1 Tax=Sphingobacterium sp. TaxID=341027 RepID=UPI0028A08894|nr:helix-turn-helix domain-containing protein [Sphingobacterium sp.]
MRTIKDKSLILREIKSYYEFKSDAEFARFLGIKPNSLANWYTRNTMDYELVFSKCEEIDANWLFTGEGDMLVRPKNQLCNTDEVGKLSIDFEVYEKIETMNRKYIQLLEDYNSLLRSKLEVK